MVHRTSELIRKDDILYLQKAESFAACMATRDCNSTSPLDNGLFRDTESRG